jgi:hypothetical protein
LCRPRVRPPAGKAGAARRSSPHARTSSPDRHCRLCCRSACSSPERNGIGRGIWELGFCPSLSVGASSDARMIGAIHQIGRLRFAPRRAAAADYSAQWAAELHRAIAANVGHARLLGLWAVELTRLARRRVGPSLGWLWKTWAKS